MTGFAQGRLEFNDIAVGISFKSLNHRFLDLGFKGTGVTPKFEKMIRDIIREKIYRGKVEIVFNLFDFGQKRFNIQFNENLLAEILERLLPIKEKFKEKIDLSLDSLLKIPMIFHLEYFSNDFDEKDFAKIEGFIGKVFAEFLKSRELEGRYILKDLLSSIKRIEKSVKIIKKSAEKIEKELFQKYREKIEKILEDNTLEDRRILQEAAILAEKSCINEEIMRVETHNTRLKDLLLDKGLEIKGKEADFLAQEMQRETHTIASKTDSLDIHQHILEIRREIEKIKQQVQNVE